MNIVPTPQLSGALLELGQCLAEVLDGVDPALVEPIVHRVADVEHLADFLRQVQFVGRTSLVDGPFLERLVDAAALVGAAVSATQVVRLADEVGELVRAVLNAPGRPLTGVLVEVVHDTTMWNEGFELAEIPWVRVVVPSQEDADRLCTWVEHTYGLARSATYVGFSTRQRRADTTAVSLGEAQWRIATAVQTFAGP